MADDQFHARTQITRVGRLKAALMLTDIVGYSRRMHSDEARAVEELRRHNEIVGDLINDHQGRVAKTIGDAFLAEFTEADSALKCALAVHEALARGFAGADPLKVRIGLHVAEVEVIGPDLIGDGVNILARIEPQASPGGICASKEFVDALQDKPVGFASLGPVEVKNIARPLELFAWPADSASSRVTTSVVDADSESLPQTQVIRPVREVNSLPMMRVAPPPAAGALFSNEEEPATQVVGAALPPPSKARPLSKGSGIFGHPDEEAFRAEEVTNIRRDEPEPSVPWGRQLQGTDTSTDTGASNSGPDANFRPSLMELPPEPEVTAIRRDDAARDDGDDWYRDSEEQGDEPGEDETHTQQAERGRETTGLAGRPRGLLIAIGSAAGVVAAGSLVTIGWMVGHSGKPKPETTVVPVATKAPEPPPAAAPAPQPAPVPVAAAAPVAPTPAPPAPVAAPPAPASAPAPAAEKPAPTRPSLAEQVVTARSRIEKGRAKSREKKALLAELNKLDRKWKGARDARSRKQAEGALRIFLKKHKLS